MFRIVLASLVCLLFSAVPAHAQQGGEESGGIKGADDLLAAVVRVKMRAVKGARSSDTLGAEREGTGVLIDDKGHILTIGYVVMEAQTIEITTQDDKTVPAALAGYDHVTGFGLLRALKPLDIRPIALGDALALPVKEPVMVLPHGGRSAAMLAYVVSRRKFTGSWEYRLDSAIFTSPPTMQWAGAALLNREGKLVGIGSLLVRDTVAPGQAVPGNMFVPVDLLKPILGDLIANGRRSGPQRPWLGLATEEVQGHLFVTRVSPDSPAENAGLRRGDIVVGVGSSRVTTHDALYDAVWAVGNAGVDVPLRVLQGAEVKEVRVRSIDRNDYFRDRASF